MRTPPARFEPLLFSRLLSGLMSLRVSAAAIRDSLESRSDFTRVWRALRTRAWLVASSAIMVVAPLLRTQAERSVERRA